MDRAFFASCAAADRALKRRPFKSKFRRPPFGPRMDCFVRYNGIIGAKARAELARAPGARRRSLKNLRTYLLPEAVRRAGKGEPADHSAARSDARA